jgi:hypothetical protein
MKICPKCEAIFDDSMNYCLEHGTELVDAATFKPDHLETTAKMAAETVEFQGAASTFQQQPTIPIDYSAPQRKKSSVWPILVVAGLAIVLIGAGVVGGALYLRKYVADHPPTSPTPRRTPVATPTTATASPEPKEKLRIETDTSTTDGKFGEKFLRCVVTNVTDKNLENAGVSLTFYKKDIKVNSRSERLPLKLLRPGETYPVWVDINDVKDYDRVVAEQGPFTRPVNWAFAAAPLDLPLTDTALKTEKNTTSYNDRLFQEPYYVVTGVIENTTSKSVHPTVDIVYYDDKSEVVGYASTSVGELKPGDKAKIEAEAAASQLHGKPTRFETIVTGN